MFARRTPIEQPIEEIRAWREKATRDRRQTQGRNKWEVKGKEKKIQTEHITEFITGGSQAV